MDKIVEVTAPSRLHFGLMSLGEADRQFGGVGAMIEQPALRLLISASDDFAAKGKSADRVRQFAMRWAHFHEREAEQACCLEVLEMPRQHAGLGSGTQLGLAVAAGLNEFFNVPKPTAAELAISVGRGLRSAVGTYGFVGGGLVVERGKSDDEPISPLDCQVPIPAEWRFVLIMPRDVAGLSGTEEQRAFDSLPAIPAEVRERLAEEVRLRMLPAVLQSQFNDFSESVYRYGHLSGSCFASQQGGAYNGERLARIVERVRAIGVAGVGQSSWGPTIFAVLPCQAAAEQFGSDIADELSEFDRPEIIITAPDNFGHRVSVRARQAADRRKTHWSDSR